MNFLRLIFGTGHIYTARTTVGALVWLLFPMLGVVLINNIITPSFVADVHPAARAVSIALWVLLAYGIGRELLKIVVAERILKKSGAQAGQTGSGMGIAISAASDELQSVDAVQKIYTGKDWDLYYAVFNFYGNYKGSRYLARRSYYTVVEIKLIRAMPHVVFDSKAAKRRQFKALFLRAQKVSMDVNFDDNFDTYIPQSYHVDTLSFISPEVLQALLRAKNYDFELVGDRLLCFGPLLEQNQWDDICEKARAVAKEVNDNIAHYKDDRLVGPERWTNVTAFAKELLENPFRYIYIIIGTGLILLGLCYLTILHPSDWRFIWFNKISQYALLFFTIYVVEMIWVMRTNKQKELSFQRYQAGAAQRAGRYINSRV